MKQPKILTDLQGGFYCLYGNFILFHCFFPGHSMIHQILMPSWGVVFLKCCQGLSRTGSESGDQL